ncbi:polyprenyl synthetase family protein [bacterium]|nr:polyprenyl synthetase family protein [bacterium]
MTFEEKYADIRQLAKDEIEFIEKFMVQNVKTREPLNSHIINFLNAPSKRIRPLLSILFYKSLYGNISDEKLKALASVELIHSASLIHDDIIDESDTRRGLKTVACEFGNKLGVICGDYLLSVAMKIVTELGSVELLKNFSNTLNKMCVGEINQNFDRFKISTIEEYIEKSKNKTAYLFETAMLTPFLTEVSYNEQASDFGLNVGIAFQIRDDLMNLTSSDSSKPVRNDITEGIYNSAVIYAGSPDNYVNGLEKTRDLLNNYIKTAYANIEKLPQNVYKKGLENFLELLGND